MAGDQMHWIFNTGDATSSFDFADPVFEQSLTTPCADERKSFGFPYGGIVSDLLLKLPFPGVEIIGRKRHYVARDHLKSRNLRANQTHQHFGEGRRDLGQVDGLQTVPVWLKWRISCR